jgi:hypothetical protein
VRFGVNYTPSEHWWHLWLDFDAPGVGEGICRDFDAIAALGLDHVRVFPIWPVFQPNRGVVRLRAVEHLVELVRLAAAAGLDVTVDGLQGHLSGFDFYPSWTLTWHRRNIFTDPAVIDAQALLLRTLAGALRTEPNYLGMTLGNEPNNLVAHNPVTPSEVDAWLDRLLAECAAAHPDHPVTHCAYDAVWYADDHPFTPVAAATKGAMTCVHPWVFSGDCARRYGPHSPQVTHLAEYVVELARAYARDPARVTWVQEFGAPAPHIPVCDAPAFVAASLRNVLSCARLWGVTWWCSHDLDPRLVDYPRLEYGLGLLRTDNAVKPVGKALARTIAEELPAVVPRPTALVLDDEDGSTRSVAAPGGAGFAAWMRLAAGGARPAVVLASRAADPVHLATRGITSLVRID